MVLFDVLHDIFCMTIRCAIISVLLLIMNHLPHRMWRFRGTTNELKNLIKLFLDILQNNEFQWCPLHWMHHIRTCPCETFFTLFDYNNHLTKLFMYRNISFPNIRILTMIQHNAFLLRNYAFALDYERTTYI